MSVTRVSLSIAALLMVLAVPVRAEDAPATPAPAKPAQSQTTPADPNQTKAPNAAAIEAPAPAKVDVMDLMAAGSLPEISEGSATAPLTIVEYHSMTCPHCAHFEETVLPTLEEKYVKTGQARIVFRAFPLNQLDAVAFMLLRCRPTEGYIDTMKALYKAQADWAFTDHPKDAITAEAKKIGFTQETFEACLKNQAIWDGLIAVAKKADETFKVDGTPTFFFNGVREGSIAAVDELEQKIAPYLKK
jgi:protein-disulfide isomerase